MHNLYMNKNFGPDQEDRGVEAGVEEVYIDGEKILRDVPPAVDGLGKPAAQEDDLGGD